MLNRINRILELFSKPVPRFFACILHFVVVAFIPGFIISRTLYAALKISGAGGPVIGSFGSLRERHWSLGKRTASAFAEPTA
jgi:hypothetical protein